MTIIRSQSAYYFLRASPILDKKFMGSAATQAKRRDLISSKEMEVARRAEFARTTFAGTYMKSYYKTGGFADRSGKGDFSKTHA